MELEKDKGRNPLTIISLPVGIFLFLSETGHSLKILEAPDRLSCTFVLVLWYDFFPTSPHRKLK